MDYDCDTDFEEEEEDEGIDQSSSDSSQSSTEDSRRMEVAVILGERLELPQGLAEDPNIFKDFLSVSLWQSLDPSDKARLQKHLPNFPKNDMMEKNITLKKLFARDNFKFGSPFNTFFNQLQNAYFRPDIAHLRKLMERAERRQKREQEKNRAFKLLKDVIVGRRELLEAAYCSPRGTIKLEKNNTSCNATTELQTRVKKRYFQELSAIRSEVGQDSQSSEDENYQEGAPKLINKKQKQRLNMLECSLVGTDMNLVQSTLSTKSSGFDLESQVTSSSNPFEMTDSHYKKLLHNHFRKKLNQEKHPELITSGINLKDVAIRTQFGQKRINNNINNNNNNNKAIEPTQAKVRKKIKQETIIKQEIKQEELELEPLEIKKEDTSTDEEVSSVFKSTDNDRNIDVENNSPTNILQNQILLEKQNNVKEEFVKSESSELDVCNFATEENSELDVMNYRETSELVQNTHTSFFSLLRDIICSSPFHRMTLENVENNLKAWEASPISPLNDWYLLVDQPWSSLLRSALSFLSADYPDLQPEDFVPYIEFKQPIQSYQWIGAGRDSDSHLLSLCSHWLSHKDDLYRSNALGEDQDLHDESQEELEEKEEVNDDFIPPSRCTTTWTVRPSREEEKKIFQEQERHRFESPTKSFTYRMHGYESIVGPVKGIYNQTPAPVKARGHNLLKLDRPPYVTILALVRDACARLPNGEGTRSDICTLMKDSQYLDLSSAGDNTLQNVVSGALDRLHYEIDSCIKFHAKRKLWIYLHRNRSEAEMEKMHQQYQGLSKTTKKSNRKKQNKQGDNTGKDVQNKDVPEKPKKTRAKTSMAMLQTFKTVKHPMKMVTKLEDVDSGDKTKEKLPGQSLLNQELLSKPIPPTTTTNQMGLTSIMGPSSPQTTQGVRVLKPVVHPSKPSTPQQLVTQQNVINYLQPMKVEQKGKESGSATPPMTQKQEIINSAGKKILIQTSFPTTGTRTPMKFVQANAAQANLLNQKLLSLSNSTNKQNLVVQTTQTPKPVAAQPGNQSPQMKSIGTQQQESPLQNIIKTQATTGKNVLAAQFGGAQFITASGQKVQIIASNAQNIGNIQGLQLGSSNLISATQQQGTGTQSVPMQQVQILTSNGHIITRAIPVSTVDTSKNPNTVRTGQLQMTLAKTSPAMMAMSNKNIKNIRMVTPQTTGCSVVTTTAESTIQKPQQSISLLTTNLNKNTEKKFETTEAQPQTTNIQMVQQQQQQQHQQQQQKPGPQLISVSSVQLVGARNQVKPLITKNSAPILTGVKLVNTQQGVKMVATSSTMVQNALQQAKNSPVGSLTKPTTVQQSLGQSTGQQRTPQIITMESLLQNAGQIRVSGATKGPSLIQLPSSSGGVPQFAVVSQGNIISVAGQPRMISAQQLSQVNNINSSQSTTVVSTGNMVRPTSKTTSLPTTSATVRVSPGVNLATFAGKPLLLASGAKGTNQSQNVILTSPSGGSGQTLVLAPQSNVRGGGNPQTLTVVQQGGGQQILIPSNFQAGALNLKAFPGMKVIPLSTTSQKGRQQMFARIVKSTDEQTDKRASTSDDKTSV